MRRILSYSFLIVSFFVVYSVISSGCAQIGAPTGGPKDSLSPVLITATPPNNTTNFTGNKITLAFDEYVTLDNLQTNLLVSPYPKSNPTINYKLRTVTIKLKDSLLPNTTYAIDFGNSVKDVNEGNIYKNLTYVFSTGDKVDSLKLSGKVMIAETGKIDSTLLVFLYRNAVDSTVQKKKPNYIARLKGDGTFTFRNLPAGAFSIYALKDDDGSKTYNSTLEEFAFADSDIVVSPTVSNISLYAYAEEKAAKKNTATSTTKKTKNNQTNKFKFTTTASSTPQDILGNLEIDFNQPLKTFDSSKIILTDTSYHPIAATLTLDSTRKKATLKAKWVENTEYRLVIDSTAAIDSANINLAKTDTVKFRSKKITDYGSILFRFSKMDASKHPVLQMVQADSVIKSIPITAPQWSDKLFIPGEYELRILYDANENGKWDAGNYIKKLQPEKVVSLDKKLVIKADWDNEREIQL